MPGYSNPYYQPEAFGYNDPNQTDYNNPNIQGRSEIMPTQDFQQEGNSNLFQKGGGWQGVASGIGAAMSQGALSDFEIDPNAGYKGSVQGFMSGGPIGAIIGGIGGQYKTFSEVNKNLKNLQTDIRDLGTDEFGNPIYNGQGVVTNRKNVNALNDGEKKIKRSLDPATRVFSGLFGTRKKIRKKRRALNNSILRSQNTYNSNKLAYNQDQLAMNRYNESLNKNDRMQNLYMRNNIYG